MTHMTHVGLVMPKTAGDAALEIGSAGAVLGAAVAGVSLLMNQSKWALVGAGVAASSLAVAGGYGWLHQYNPPEAKVSGDWSSLTSDDYQKLGVGALGGAVLGAAVCYLLKK